MSYYVQQTTRLKLRRLTHEDAIPWSEFFIDNPRAAYLGLDLSKPAVVLAEEWIERQFIRYETEGLGFLAGIDSKTEELIGLAGLVSREVEQIHAYEIGYSVLPRFWGLGYATEMAQQLRLWGHQHKLAPAFISIIMEGNTYSERVATKNNMKPIIKGTYQGTPVTVFSDGTLDELKYLTPLKR
jgi:ribosomal-protein-alanine N-acetyltransferase